MSTAAQTENESGAPRAFSEAIIRQWTWKTPAMKAMTLAVCRLALARGTAEFSANDLPEFEHGGSGIAGCIFHRLIEDGIISRVGHFEGGKFFPKVVGNSGGNKIGVYRLAGGELARTLLDVHGAPAAPALTQEEMKLP